MTYAPLASIALIIATLTTFQPAKPVQAAGAAPPRDCFSALRHAKSARLTCEHKAWMTDNERADLVSMTRGYLLDARCTVAVDIERGLIDAALAASDTVFTTPAQPVTCDLQTSNGPMKIGGTFAPKVTFKDGFAADATPGLANITGVNSYLAMPVVAYVNHAPGIKAEMAAMINAFRTQLTARQATR